MNDVVTQANDPAGTIVPAAWHELLLSAGMLPPLLEPAAHAVDAWRRARSGATGAAVGPLVWLDRDLPALPAALRARGSLPASESRAPAEVDLHLVLWDTPPTYERSIRAAEAVDGARLDAVCTRLPLGGGTRITAARAVTAVEPLLPDGVRAYTETPLEPGWQEAVNVLAEYGHGAALRLGEPAAAPLPTPELIAEFLIACLDRDVGFITVGGPAQLLPASGRPGFGTLMLATRAAFDGAGAADVAALLLAEPSGPVLREVAGGSLRTYLQGVSVGELGLALTALGRAAGICTP